MHFGYGLAAFNMRIGYCPDAEFELRSLLLQVGSTEHRLYPCAIVHERALEIWSSSLEEPATAFQSRFQSVSQWSPLNLRLVLCIPFHGVDCSFWREVDIGMAGSTRSFYDLQDNGNHGCSPLPVLMSIIITTRAIAGFAEHLLNPDPYSASRS